MSLEATINKDIITLMKAKDKQALNALRAVKSAILLAKTEKGSKDEISEEVEIKILQRLVKQRKESAQLYKEQGRNDLFEEENAQLKIIEKYLPAQIDEKTLRLEIQKIISDTGASSMKDMGKVMGMASKKFAGTADNKLISTIVKQALMS